MTGRASTRALIVFVAFGALRVAALRLSIALAST
jgi:hypothetical protein